jgi:alpha-glucosidase
MKPNAIQPAAARPYGIIALLLLFAPLPTRADPLAQATTTHIQFRLAAAPAQALRFSIATGPVSQIPSIFLAPDATKPAPAKSVTDGDWQGLATPAGQLLINGRTGQWKLTDPAGNNLIAPSSFPQINADNLTCALAPSREGPEPHYYGSGNRSHALQMTAGPTQLGNGIAEVPFYWSTAGYAVLVISRDDNRPASWTLDAQNQPVWTIPGNAADFYFFPGNLDQAERAYATLTGPPPVPPEWTFGYLQSRWGWTNRTYIFDTLKHFEIDKLPVDGFIFDFEWFTPTVDYHQAATGQSDYQDFDWNAELFPDPANDIAQLHSSGVHVVGIRKPRLGNSASLAQAAANHWLVDSNINGTVDARNLDFKNPDVRKWYAEQTLPLLKAGLDGWWDDEGELTFTTYIYWTMAQAQALAQIDPTARLWTLCRAFSPGLERLGGAAWTGDISPRWSDFKNTPTALLNWSLAGMNYSTCDIGGFQMPDTTAQLLTRWMQAGVFFPIMRAHSTRDATPHFPWLYGPEAETAIRKALELRYRLIPYYYSLAHDSYQTGERLMRPLIMDFPNDPALADLSDEWLMGPSLLAAPMIDRGNVRSVYLPHDKWFEFDTNTLLDGGTTLRRRVSLDDIPAYVRAGSILPLAPPILHTDQLPGGPLELQIYPGRDATFTLYEDDGRTTSYQHGQQRRTTFTWTDATRTLSWSIDPGYTDNNIFTGMNIKLFDPAAIQSAQAPLNKPGNHPFGK